MPAPETTSEIIIGLLAHATHENRCPGGRACVCGFEKLRRRARRMVQLLDAEAEALGTEARRPSPRDLPRLLARYPDVDTGPRATGSGSPE